MASAPGAFPDVLPEALCAGTDRRWHLRRDHGANHEALLSLGCAMICCLSLRKTLTRRTG